jgi:hypothetical protein
MGKSAKISRRSENAACKNLRAEWMALVLENETQEGEDDE